MFQTNLPTLLLILSVNKFLLGMLMGYLWIKLPEIKGIKDWFIGSVLTATGLFIFAVYPYPVSTPVDFTYSISLNLLIMSGDIMFLSGFVKFQGKPFRKSIYLVFLLLVSASTVYFTLIHKILWMRVFLNTSFYVVLYLFIAAELWKYPKGNLRFIFRISSILYVFYAALQLSRVVYAFLYPPETPQDNSQFSLVLFSIAGVSMILLTFNLIIIITTKLNEELHAEIQTKNKLYAIISHDLRGSISNYLNYTTVLKESVEKWEPEKTKLWIGEMEKSSVSSRYILENLLYWSRDQLKELRSNLNEVNINLLISQLIKSMKGQADVKSVTLISNVPETIKIISDNNLLEIILRNIILNAIKFTPENGSISISVTDKMKKLSIVVNDNGVGIPAEILENIMTQKQITNTAGTAMEKGSGFGLKLCFDLMRLLNGKINIKSAVGVGTEIELQLPKK